ncbi:MAG: hypothetical protein KJ630_00375 [Proteobacteria bacterium]|nr:hypothetical protein [Pseudomonadota bacterium]
MIQIFKNSGETAIRILIVISVIFMPSLLLAATTGTPSTTPIDTTTPSSMAPFNEIDFDGKGYLEHVDQIIQDSKGDDQNFASSASVIIDGHQQVFSSSITLYHYLSRPVTEDDIKPGAYVGFKKDPDDKIAELWVLKPVPKKVLEPEPQISAKDPAPPQGNTNPIKNVDGIWTN